MHIQILALPAILVLFLPSAHAFDGIRVTLLGTSAQQAAAGPGPSTLVETGDEVLLFDCGAGTRSQLERAGVALGDVTALFLSKLEPGRLQGCPELWRDRAKQGGGGALPVWGPEGTRALVDRFESEAGLASRSAALGFEIADNVVYQPEGLTVTAFVTDSGAGAASFGYRVDAVRRSVTLSGSTGYSENVIRYARGVQVLLHEVAAAAAGTPAEAQLRGGHTSPEEAARVFRAARPYLAVYSNMLLLGVSAEDVVRRTRNAYRGPVEAGRDLMVIEVQNEVQIRMAPSEPRLGAPR